MITKDVSISAKKISPHTHAFIFDNDNTLLANGITDKWRLIVAYLPAILVTFVSHPILIFNLLKDELLDENSACSQQWQELFKQMGNQRSAEYQFSRFVEQWAAMKTIVPGMDTLIQQLHDAGYRLSLWTDMGAKDGHVIEKKFPHLYHLFTLRSYVTYEQDTDAIRKPSEQAVKKFVTLYQHTYHENKTLIFVDDKLKNCLAAKKYGAFDYIQFKSPEHLRTLLHSFHTFDH